MARMMGRSRFPIDAALIVRAEGSAAMTANTDMPVQKLVSNGAYWQDPPDVRNGESVLVGHVESLAGTTALEVDIYLCDDASKTNPVLFETHGGFAAGEWFEIDIDEFSAIRHDPTATYWYATVKPSGNSGSPSAAVFLYIAPDAPSY